MATETILVNLRASKVGGELVSYQEFLEPILDATGKSEYTIRKSKKKWQAAGFDFFKVSYDEFNSTEQDEGMFEKVVSGKFVEVSGWLERIETSMIDGMSDLNIILNISTWITSDQFDLEIPSEFLNQIGRLGIKIKICSNT